MDEGHDYLIADAGSSSLCRGAKGLPADPTTYFIRGTQLNKPFHFFVLFLFLNAFLQAYDIKV